MERNVGGLDRWLHIVVGILVAVGGTLALAGYWHLGPVIGVVGLIVGVVLVLTGATQTCPIYAAIGIGTKGRE